MSKVRFSAHRTWREWPALSSLRLVQTGFDPDLDDVGPGQDEMPASRAAFHYRAARNLAQVEIIVPPLLITPFAHVLNLLLQQRIRTKQSSHGFVCSSLCLLWLLLHEGHSIAAQSNRRGESS